MESIRKILIVVLMIFMAGGINAASQIKVDIGKGAKKHLPGGKVPAEVAVVELPEKNLRALDISWDTAASKYIEIAFMDRPKLPEFTRAAVTARIQAPAGCPVTRIGLRLVDTEGEIFQYTRQVNFQAGGEFEVVWDVPAGEWKSSWGRNANKHLDQPAQIHGFGVDYRQNSGESGFQLISLTATIAGGEQVVAMRPFFPFDSDGLCQKTSGRARLSQGDHGLIVSGINGTNIITERRTSLKYIEYRPVNLVLEAEKLSGNVMIAWRIKDGSNREFKTGEQALKPGSNRLIYNVRDIFKDAALPLSSPRLVITGGDNGGVLLKSANIGLSQPLTEAVDFEILTGNRIHVLKAGMEKSFAFQLINRADREGDFNFELEFIHFDGQRFTESFNVVLPPGKITTFVPEWFPERFGHWNVVVKISEKDTPDSSSRIEKSFAYLKPSGPTPGFAPGFLFGVCTHASRWSRTDQMLEAQAAALCGAKVVRDSVEWGGLQPERDRWNFTTMDFLVDLFDSYGIEHQALLAFTTKWAAAPELRKSKNWRDWSRGAPEINAWREYVRTMMERYRGRIRYWEVWNEPDLTGFNRMSLDEYVELQKATFETASQTAPEATVMTGGFATMSDHSGRKSPTFHEDFMVKAKGFFKVHAYHEHGPFQRFSQMVDERFIPMRRRTGTSEPWYANETAIASMNGSEYNQALVLFKKLLFAWARGAIGYSWYDLRNDGYNPGDAEHHYGMMTNDFYPKPVYSVFNTLTGIFMNAGFQEQWDAGDNYWVFKFADTDNILLPSWSESGFGAARMLVVKTDAAAAESIDLMGNASPQQIIDGMTLLSVNPTPYTLRLKNARTATNAGTLITISSGAVAVTGQPFNFNVELFNPLKEKHEFQLELNDMPIAFKADKTRRQTTVAPRSSAKVEFALTVSNDYKPVYGRTENMRLNYRISGTSWNGTITVPVNSAILIPRRGELTGRPDFVLNRQEQTFSLVAADPALGHRIWRGAEDLSAMIYLAEESGNLRLQAEVTDDVHHQPYSGREVWRGDNIQLAFQVPGQTGYWEFGLSHLSSGKSETVVFQAPSKFEAEKVNKEIKLTTFRSGVKTVYELSLNLQAVGLTPELLYQGIRLNLLVNDNDGEGRDGWIHIAPGIGENKNPDIFPFVMFAR